jgi:hypothetical protein
MTPLHSKHKVKVPFWLKYSTFLPSLVATSLNYRLFWQNRPGKGINTDRFNPVNEVIKHNYRSCLLTKREVQFV